MLPKSRRVESQSMSGVVGSRAGRDGKRVWGRRRENGDLYTYSLPQPDLRNPAGVPVRRGEQLLANP